MTEPFSISSGSSTTSQSLTVQLQREALFLDSAVSGLTYSRGTTATTNQDGLLYYFPSNPVSLSLGNVTLGTFVEPIPGVLTPYKIFDVNEGTVDDRVTNFANSCNLLISMLIRKTAFNLILLRSPTSIPISTSVTTPPLQD